MVPIPKKGWIAREGLTRSTTIVHNESRAEKDRRGVCNQRSAVDKPRRRRRRRSSNPKSKVYRLQFLRTATTIHHQRRRRSSPPHPSFFSRSSLSKCALPSAHSPLPLAPSPLRPLPLRPFFPLNYPAIAVPRPRPALPSRLQHHRSTLSRCHFLISAHTNTYFSDQKAGMND